MLDVLQWLDERAGHKPMFGSFLDYEFDVLVLFWFVMCTGSPSHGLYGNKQKKQMTGVL